MPRSSVQAATVLLGRLRDQAEAMERSAIRVAALGGSRHRSPSPCGKLSEPTTPRRLRSGASVNESLRSNFSV